MSKYPLYCMYYVGRKKKGELDKKKSNIISTAIRIFSLGRESHVELLFPKEVVGDKNSFSSSGHDGGVRFKDIKYSHPKRWRPQKIGEYAKEEILTFRAACEPLVGDEYDYSVIPRFGFGLPVDVADKWWCSEVVINRLKLMGILPRRFPENITPVRMRKLIKRWLNK